MGSARDQEGETPLPSKLVFVARRHFVMTSMACFVAGALTALVLANVFGQRSVSATESLVLLLIAAVLGAGASLPRLARESVRRARRRAGR